MWRRTILGMLVVIAALIGWRSVVPKDSAVLPEKQAIIDLKRGNLTLLQYAPKQYPPRAILLFGSGDGGWGTLEDAVATELQKHGYLTIGIDSAAYATTDYDNDTLQADFSAIAQSARASSGRNPPPVIVGGYSMGAAQAIAAVGGPHPPQGLIGLLLMDPLSRGRYGLREADRANVLPMGPGTFGVKDFAPAIHGIRVVQWHAENDPIDSREWLTSLTVPFEERDLAGAGHGYDVGREEFLPRLVKSADWILDGANRVMAEVPTK